MDFLKVLFVLMLSTTGLESGVGHASWKTEIQNVYLTVILDNSSDDVMYSDKVI